MAACEKSAAESIECFIEDQAFSRGRMIWLLPPPLPHLLSLSSTGDTQTDKEIQHADRRGDGGGAKSYDRKKAWSSINHSILSSDAERPRYTVRHFIILLNISQ
jgi:hypothetical protein